MSVTNIAKLLPILGIACMVSLPAMAQTAASSQPPAPSGTMTPTATAKPAKTHSSTHSHTGLPASERFSTVSAATAHCPHSTVEWTALNQSKDYHGSKSKYYGKTKHGAYACKSALDAAGFHQAKN
ncbi:hypothetical protein [Acidocella sp.]|uniref:hypothetical protein n=1 Tax=Acidocella sp. TaxID=50710 RepID=UPI003D011872